MGAIPIVEEVSFIFSFVSSGLVTKSLGVGWVHIWGGGTENKTSKKMNVNPFTLKLGWTIWPLVSKGQNPLKLLYSIMILNTISPPYKGRADKRSHVESLDIVLRHVGYKWSFWVKMLWYSHLTFNTKKPSPTPPHP